MAPRASPFTVICGDRATASERVRATRAALLIVYGKWSDPGRRARQSKMLTMRPSADSLSERANAWLSRNGAVKLRARCLFHDTRPVLNHGTGIWLSI